VTKSAGAAQGKRPMPPDHFESTSLATQLSLSGEKKITIVDDVITRGSTLVGMSPHVVAGFPDCGIRCFALVRTISGVEVETLEAPVIGSIEYNGGNYLHREP
jgi:orotate phosphoribosyltransferase-like protein